MDRTIENNLLEEAKQYLQKSRVINPTAINITLQK